MSPNAPRTPHRTFRISDSTYLAAQAAAAKRGESLTDVIRRTLEVYGDGKHSPVDRVAAVLRENRPSAGDVIHDGDWDDWVTETATEIVNQLHAKGGGR